jgi:hypothetical protein
MNAAHGGEQKWNSYPRWKTILLPGYTLLPQRSQWITMDDDFLSAVEEDGGEGEEGW